MPTVATAADSLPTRAPKGRSERGNNGKNTERSIALAKQSRLHTLTAIRILRLLSLYRCVIGLAFALIAAPATGLTSASYAASFSYAAWALISLLTFKRFAGRVGSLLFVQLCIDLVFIGFAIFTTKGSITAYAVYLFPIAATHGWFYRSRIAFGHAALATIVLLLTEWGMRTMSTSAITEAAVIGAGYFLLTAIGMLLGRNAQESESLAVSRSEDIRRLAQVNQIVISELKDGVIVVGAQGQIVMANPQARRWLLGDEAMMMTGEPRLEQVAPSLAARWRDFFESNVTLDSSPVTILRNNATDGETGIASKKILSPRMIPIDLDARAGTLIFLEDSDAAQAEAQQIKLAALGRLSASIAHEIRNPLSAIKQAAQLIAEEVSDSPQAIVLAAMIDKNTERIDRIVRDVSLLGRRDRGTPADINLKSFIDECVHELAPLISAQQGFELSLDPKAVIRADRGHLEEMLNNLLSNAWRHSQKLTRSVRVVVSTNSESQRASIAVMDDGSGVPKNMADKIFEPFFSGSGSTGLGLYLVRELAQANGGSVRLGQSARGARFVLELPLAMN
jgi:two-component system, NtrC family, sensor histidine kinase PilS